MFLTDEACRAANFVVYSNNGVVKQDRDGRKKGEVEGPDDVEKFVLLERVNELVVDDHLRARMACSWEFGARHPNVT